MVKKYERTLTIAGSDSGGGAGIQADLKTFSALGCYGLSVITALTAQNTHRVTAIHAVPPAFIAQQLDAVLGDIGADAVKVGMLHSAKVIHTVAERLVHHRVENIVLDPVMVAKSGDRLLQDTAIDALRSELIPLCTVITPNLPEASVLLAETIEGRAQMESAAQTLCRLGPQSVLLKGGHLEGAESLDVFCMSETGDTISLRAQRIATRNNHGTGCTLSSAIAAYLAQGCDIAEAVRCAKTYITGALAAGADYRLGGEEGHGPVHHFHQLWEQAE